MVHTKGLNDVVLQREITIQTNPSYRKMHRFFFVKTLAFENKTKLDDQKLESLVCADIGRSLSFPQSNGQPELQRRSNEELLAARGLWLYAPGGRLAVDLSLSSWVPGCLYAEPQYSWNLHHLHLPDGSATAGSRCSWSSVLGEWRQALRNNHCSPSFTYILNQIMQQYN